MKRRNLLYGGTAAVAGLAGAGAAWWTSRPPGAQLLAPGEAGRAPAPGEAAEEAAASFWRMSFQTPDGHTLPMDSFRGKRLLVNFWATWCPPCVEELPLLERFYQQNKAKDWQLVALAVDQAEAVRRWLQARPLGFAVGIAGLQGIGLSQSLGNTAGGLPFSLVFDSSGALLHRKVGKVSEQELAVWAQLE